MNDAARAAVLTPPYHAPLSRLLINLDGVAHNYLSLKKKLGPETDCAAVVKADAYGLGADAVSQTLFRQGCRHFFVAQGGEGLSLRQALPPGDAPGNDTAIYVLNGPCGIPAREFIGAQLTPVLNSLGDIEYWAGVAASQNRRLPALLHIDTGMNRLGLSAGEVVQLAARPDLLAALDIRYVMSHLARADEPAEAMNEAQLSLFRQLAGALQRPFRYSLANSGGVFLGPEYHFDLVRPGAAIYGINTSGQSVNPMQPVVSLYGRILQTREIERAGSVGYAATYPISPPAKCATISVGYADGYLRSLSGRGHVYIHGEKCPVIGRVSMDCLVVDTTLMKVQPQAGEEAELLGRHHTVDDLAAEAGTIGYEIITSLGPRLKRTYEGTDA